MPALRFSEVKVIAEMGFDKEAGSPWYCAEVKSNWGNFGMWIVMDMRQWCAIRVNKDEYFDRDAQRAWQPGAKRPNFRRRVATAKGQAIVSRLGDYLRRNPKVIADYIAAKREGEEREEKERIAARYEQRKHDAGPMLYTALKGAIEYLETVAPLVPQKSELEGVIASGKMALALAEADAIASDPAGASA